MLTNTLSTLRLCGKNFADSRREEPPGKRTIPLDTLYSIERDVARGRNVQIIDCVIKGQVSLGARFGVEVPSDMLSPEEWRFFGNPTTVRIVRGLLSIKNSFADSIDGGSPIQFQLKEAGSAQIKPQDVIVYSNGIQLISNNLRDNFIGFSKAHLAGRIVVRNNRASELGQLQFGDCWFADSLQTSDFGGNEFHVAFWRSVFANGVYLAGSHFPGTATFENAKFPHGADFSGTVFEGYAFFSGAGFKSIANFAQAKFGGLAVFDNSDVWDLLILRGATFEKGASFNDWTLHEHSQLHLSYIRAQGKFFGLLSNQADLAINRLYDTHLTSVKSEQEQFRNDPNALEESVKEFFVNGKPLPNKVFIFKGQEITDEAEFRKWIKWSESSEALAVYETQWRHDKISALQFLEANFREFGLKDDALILYREIKSAERPDRPWYWKIVDLLIDLTCGYGTQPGKVLLTALICIVLFSGLYYPFGVKTAEERTLECGRPRRPLWIDSVFLSANLFLQNGYGGWQPAKNRLCIPFHYPVIYLSLRTWRIARSRKRHQFPVNFYFFTTLESVLGWLVLALFIVTLARVWIE